MQACYHSSIEGAQHGVKSLPEFLDYAKASGASGAQPSNYMIQAPGSGERVKFQPKGEILQMFSDRGLSIDGISCHCPIWVHTTAWTGSPTIRPFIPADVAKRPPAKIEAWCENYMLKFMDFAVELGVKILPTFWGVAYGWEVATGYPWGFWAMTKKKGEVTPGDYDFIKEGNERFVKKTAKIRAHANNLGIVLAHEIHPGTAAMCADDFNSLVTICGGDKCLGVNADPSHCWEGESWESRFLKVGERIYAAHIKNFVIRPGFPLRMMESDWQKRAVQFVDLPSGDINMQRYAELLIQVGYPSRYCQVMGRKTAPLVVEAESAHKDLDYTSANGIAYVRDFLTWPVAKGSFEDGMGA